MSEDARKHPPSPFETPGHPLWVLRQENLAIEKLMREEIDPEIARLNEACGQECRDRLLQAVRALQSVELHYQKIEKLLFPFMDTNGMLAAARVMQAVHDDVRRMLRDLTDVLERPDSESKEITVFADYLRHEIQLVIRQEREAYAQKAEALIAEADWQRIEQGFREIGYCLIPEPVPWNVV